MRDTTQRNASSPCCTAFRNLPSSSIEIETFPNTRNGEKKFSKSLDFPEQNSVHFLYSGETWKRLASKTRVTEHSFAAFHREDWRIVLRSILDDSRGRWLVLSPWPWFSYWTHLFIRLRSTSRLCSWTLENTPHLHAHGSWPAVDLIACYNDNAIYASRESFLADGMGARISLPLLLRAFVIRLRAQRHAASQTSVHRLWINVIFDGVDFSVWGQSESR